MRIAVMGAGVVSCYDGGRQARDSCEVVLIGWPQQVAAICRDGLFLDTQTFREHVSVGTAHVAGKQLVLC